MKKKALFEVDAEVKEINRKITAIFKKHKMKPGPGEEEFWLAARAVSKKSKTDGKRLRKLADHWAVAMSFNLERK